MSNNNSTRRVYRPATTGREAPHSRTDATGTPNHQTHFGSYHRDQHHEPAGSSVHAGDSNPENVNAGLEHARRYDGSTAVNHRRPNLWADDGENYTDPQVTRSVIGEVPAFDGYGHVGQQYAAISPPMQYQSSPLSPSNLPHLPTVEQQYRRAVYQSNTIPQAQPQPQPQQQGQQQQQQQQQRVSYQMQGFLRDGSDYQYYWRANGGRSA